MKYTLAILAVTNVVGVLSHGYVTKAVIDGKSYDGYNPYADPYMSPAPQRIFRPIPGNGPVMDVSSIDIQCNGWTSGGVVGSKPAALSAPVTAGSSITLSWTTWPDTHKGWTATYMAKCPGDCSTYQPGTQAVWFKIAEQGKLASAPVEKGGTWFSDSLVDNKPYTFTIPKSLADGNYIIRHEITGMQSAYAYDPVKGADGSVGTQFYPSCLQVTVQGGGSESGPSSKVAFPGAYTGSTPGVVYDIFSHQGLDFPIPGPAVWTGGSGGSSNPTTTRATTTTRTTTVAPPLTTTTTRPQTTTTTTRAQTTTTTARPTTTTQNNGGNCAGLYGQCGGQGWSGPTCEYSVSFTARQANLT
uniref:lytic cellulose monooxygenase (C4-dehydrogenating) n=1 Tax=Rhizophlyctis rosea TaxID=64517 RepID=A0A2U8U9N5_9FUNG|nr:lytic polysaccharide monooxygenase 9 [Rhizophlyctis rosea]